MNTRPISNRLVEDLLPIWQRVLPRKSIGIDDDFFALGGELDSAEQLFADVRELTGQDLPAVCIYHMRTPAKMTEALEQSETMQFPQPVLLKDGAGKPPVFFAHGIGANVLHFVPLVTQMQTDRPIYGIQSRGTYGIEKPHENIEEMAQYHFEAIRKIQGHGPYLLVGYSLGGLIMMEVARQLLAAGEQIPLLLMVDSYPYRTQLRIGQQLRLYSRLAIRRAAVKLGFMHKVSRPTLIRPGKHPFPPEQEPAASEEQDRVKEENSAIAAEQANIVGAYHALRNYKPRFYPGRMKFVRASVVTDFPADARKVWGHLVGQLEVDTISGDHLDFLSASTPLLAVLLSRYLSETPAIE